MGKYFKYAIGEIILVVIGILIALQINNWNENRLNSNEEKTILKALKEEISGNQVILNKKLKQHNDAVRLTKELSNTFSAKPKEIDGKRLDSLMFALCWLPEYVPKDGVINSILTSGKISLIKNDKLNSKLAGWSSLLNNYNTAINWSEKDVFELIIPYIKDKYPFKRTLKHFNAETKEKSKFKFSQEALLSDMAFESLTANRVIDAKDALRGANQLYAFQSKILELIETELEE